MGLQFEGRLSTGQDALDRDLQDLHLVSNPEGVFLYAGTGRNGGLSVYTFDSGASAQLLDTTYFSALPAGIEDMQIGMLSISGAEVLIAGTSSSGNLLYYAIEPDGALGKAKSLALPGTGDAIWTGSEEEPDEIFVIDQGTGIISAYDLAGTEITPVASGSGSADLSLNGALMTSVSTEIGTVLITMDGGSVPELVSYHVQVSNGALIQAGQAGAAEGLGLSAPTALESVTAYGASWSIVAAAGSSTFSVLRVGADGTLTPTDHVLDTLDTRFGGVQALSVVEAEGHVFIFVGGADDGLAVFTLLPNGRLVHLQSITEMQGLGLSDVTVIEAARFGDEIHVFVASEGLPGLSQFSWSIAALGEVRTGGGTPLLGTAADDVLVAEGAETVTIRGGAGDDILVSGDGAGLLWGEAGADIFVVPSVDSTVRIADFEPGQDKLDLSLLPMLRTPDQLTVTGRPGGVQLDFGSTRIVIDSISGAPLQIQNIWDTGRFSVPDRFLVEWATPPRLLHGSDAAETLLGDKGQDTVYAVGGDDLVNGYGGSDELWGGAGQDTLQGGSGNDTLLGAGGADALWGGDDNDHIEGGNGTDSIGGGAGQDRLLGGLGSDTLWGGAAADTLMGEQGDDRLLGEDGTDELWGGDGHDHIAGGDGADSMGGGNGTDSLFGSFGNDTIWGGNGWDELWGGDGADQLYGSEGQDTIRAGEGADLVDAGKHDDLVWANAGNDTVYGGGGHDRIDSGKGNDLIYGGNGQDAANGQAGRDTIWGGDGADTLSGGAGKDILGGGGGDDTLDGGAGDDLLHGMSGADIFVFGTSHGNDRILDFMPGEDLIRIEGLSFADLTFTQHADGAEITSLLGTLLLEGLTPDQLTAGDFLFV